MQKATNLGGAIIRLMAYARRKRLSTRWSCPRILEDRAIHQMEPPLCCWPILGGKGYQRGGVALYFGFLIGGATNITWLIQLRSFLTSIKMSCFILWFNNCSKRILWTDQLII